MVWQLWLIRVNRIQFVRIKVVKHETQFGNSCTISNHKGMSKKMNIKRNELAIFLHFDSQFDFVAIFVLKTKETEIDGHAFLLSRKEKRVRVTTQQQMSTSQQSKIKINKSEIFGRIKNPFTCPRKSPNI